MTLHIPLTDETPKRSFSDVRDELQALGILLVPTVRSPAMRIIATKWSKFANEENLVIEIFRLATVLACGMSAAAARQMLSDVRAVFPHKIDSEPSPHDIDELIPLAFEWVRLTTAAWDNQPIVREQCPQAAEKCGAPLHAPHEFTLDGNEEDADGIAL